MRDNKSQYSDKVNIWAEIIEFNNPVDMLKNVRNFFRLRLAHCCAVEGRQFEHLIYNHY